ncbi:MAG: hypothetical protein IIA60_09270, partial [Candidatus Marinimicrobia bacterium]|nr:hypothetical protein [Candidatus Neomarinimicrobiota bacterium]
MLKTFLMVIMLFGVEQDLHGQIAYWTKKHLTRGKVWVSINNSGTLGPVDLPWPFYTLDYPGHSSGIDKSDMPSYIETGGYAIYGEREGTPAAYTITGRFATAQRYVYPTESSVLTTNYNMEDPSLLAEEIVTGSHHVISLDVDVTEKAMVWSYPKYDDFIIQEYTFVNTGTHDITGFRFAPTAELTISTGSGTGWWRDDDYYEWDLDHEAFYFHDGREFDSETGRYVDYVYGLTKSDKGDPADLDAPNAITHEFRSPGYLTYY